MHMLAMRQVADTLRTSVYDQLNWAIEMLGVRDKFKSTTSPLEIKYLPTGQTIYFRGADDVMKIKSIKPPFGAISILWLEETNEFRGTEAIRNITQSAIRGTDKAFIFKSWNPPRTSGNWINKYILIPKENQFQHKTDYRNVPIEWLGKIFVDEAEHLRDTNLPAYEHEYLGEVNGLGDQIFTNLIIGPIADEKIAQFDNVLYGLDFGFYPHPAHYAKVHYDATNHDLYVYGEVRKWKTSNRDMYDALVAYGYPIGELLICDSAEPKSVADFREYGASARGAEKGAESVKYSIKWMQSLHAIYIDNVRAPYTVEELSDYAYERTKDGEILESYPREKDDALAAIRYATNLIWRRRGQ
jgi:PBSX family phage terminase large subunit